MSVTAKEMFGEAGFLLHKEEDLESQGGRAISALRCFQANTIFLLSFLRAIELS